MSNPLAADPSRTSTLRRKFVGEFYKRYDRLKGAILRLIVKEDALGIKIASRHLASTLANTRWVFHTNPQKIAAFQVWLQGQVNANVLTQQNKYWEAYIQEGYQKGAGRAFNDVRKAGLWTGDEGKFYQGTKQEFLRQAFGRPETVEKIQLLAGRTFTDLKGVNEVMATTMSRVLTDGLVQGQNPLVIARSLNKTVDKIGRTRSQMIARTEIIRAHAQGQLDAMRRMGVSEVGVMVEWSTTGDDRVCGLCEDMNGVVMTLKEADGIIPRHPNCRCAYVPANVGENKTDQIRGKERVEKAFSDSIRREIPKKSKRTLAEQRAISRWVGADKRIVKQRPVSALDRRPRGTKVIKTAPKPKPRPTAPPSPPTAPDLPFGTAMNREEVIEHIMATNPPEQVKNMSMNSRTWSNKFLSEEPGGYRVINVHPKAMQLPMDAGDLAKVQRYEALPKGKAPAIVVDSNAKIQARYGGGKLDRAFGMQRHTVIDGKHRVEAALRRGDGSMKAIVPIERVSEITRFSHQHELWDFIEDYAKKKGYVIDSIEWTAYGPRVKATTVDGLSRAWGPTDIEKIAKKLNHKWKFIEEVPKTPKATKLYRFGDATPEKELSMLRNAEQELKVLDAKVKDWYNSGKGPLPWGDDLRNEIQKFTTSTGLGPDAGSSLNIYQGTIEERIRRLETIIARPKNVNPAILSKIEEAEKILKEYEDIVMEVKKCLRAQATLPSTATEAEKKAAKLALLKARTKKLDWATRYGNKGLGGKSDTIVHQKLVREIDQREWLLHRETRVKQPTAPLPDDLSGLQQHLSERAGYEWLPDYATYGEYGESLEKMALREINEVSEDLRKRFAGVDYHLGRQNFVQELKPLPVTEYAYTGSGGKTGEAYGQCFMADSKEGWMKVSIGKTVGAKQIGAEQFTFDEGHWTIGGGQIKAVYRHEFGHKMHGKMSWAEKDRWENLSKKFIRKSEGAMTPVNKKGGYYVTDYAGINSQELFAESFAAYTHPKYVKGLLPKSIENFLDDFLSLAKL